MGIFATPITSYIGSRYNKAKIIATCTIFYSIGCILFTMPYFFSERYSLVKGSSPLRNVSLTSDVTPVGLSVYDLYDLCKTEIEPSSLVHLNHRSAEKEAGGKTANCTRNTELNQWPFIAFIVSQTLLSLGAAPLLPLGITYLCDHLEKRMKNPSIYTGV